jgi:hypothetical protein
MHVVVCNVWVSLCVTEDHRTLPLMCSRRNDDIHVFACTVYHLYLIAISFKESDAVTSEVLLFCYCVTLHIWS